ncbi:MAG: hypothetical protein A2Y24_00050 [Clostridiales bacterium GWE2_32_10]|nr:MAG: hypothetical protein A2Y24_00050 [Clostridiales bacterium GWE2_32_10]HBY20134.1 hypothetical protein [Clostridiales bacterium]
MNDNKLLTDELKSKIVPMFESDNTGHDIYHIERTLNLANYIQKHVGGDKVVVVIGSLLHDVHRSIQNEQTGKFCEPKNSLDKVSNILDSIESVNLTKEQRAKILHCVEFHEGYTDEEKEKYSDIIEAKIIQDADKLDEIGAIGMGRHFVYGGKYKSKMWDPDCPITKRDLLDESVDDPSDIHYVIHKCYEIKNTLLNFQISKEVAQSREKFTIYFVNQFIEEWEKLNLIQEETLDKDLNKEVLWGPVNIAKAFRHGGIVCKPMYNDDIKCSNKDNEDISFEEANSTVAFLDSKAKFEVINDNKFAQEFLVQFYKEWYGIDYDSDRRLKQI